MKSAIKTRKLTAGATKTVASAVIMTGTVIGALKVREIVSCNWGCLAGNVAGLGVMLLGSALSVAACSGVDRALTQSTPPLVIDMASDNLKVLINEPECDLDDLEGEWDD